MITVNVTAYIYVGKDCYPIKNVRGNLNRIAGMQEGDIYSIEGLGFLEVVKNELKHGIPKDGVEQRYIHIKTELL